LGSRPAGTLPLGSEDPGKHFGSHPFSVLDASQRVAVDRKWSHVFADEQNAALGVRAVEHVQLQFQQSSPAGKPLRA
jgi:hypothetical protein